jgi:hypothetical protein|tara:strand:+ start:1657 stop:2079 length:423 start_codon:yes stop_codon:yes gene_type:complete
MASIQNDIRAALESHLAGTSGLPSIAYENVAFEPTTGTSFLKVQYLPTVTRPAVRGLNPQLRYQGIFAVTVFTPEGKGPAAADDYSNKVIDAFAATTDISFTNGDAETIKVSIDYAERQQGIIDSPWYFVPINIGWYIYK